MSCISPWMNPERESFRDAVRRFVDAEITPHQERWKKQQHVDRELWHKAGAMGMLLANIPEEYGGAGGGFAHQCRCIQEMMDGKADTVLASMAKYWISDLQCKLIDNACSCSAVTATCSNIQSRRCMRMRECSAFMAARTKS